MAFAVDGCVPMSSRCRMSNSDDLAPSGSAHGYLGIRLAWTPGEGGGLPVSARAKSASPHLTDPQRPGMRNPQSHPAHDASRSSPVGWNAASIGPLRGGGDKMTTEPPASGSPSWRATTPSRPRSYEEGVVGRDEPDQDESTLAVSATPPAADVRHARQRHGHAPSASCWRGTSTRPAPHRASAGCRRSCRRR